MEETVNRNLEKYQTPYWRSHNSLVGWCQMNYPTTLVNQRTRREPSPKNYELNELSYVHQKRPPSATKSSLYKPVTHSLTGRPMHKEDKISLPPIGFKNSTLTLTTTPMLDKYIIKKEMTKDPNVSRVKPLNNELGDSDFKEKFSIKIVQVGDIHYHESRIEEAKRHYSRLPNTIMTEQALKEMLNSKLEYLDLSNLTWVTNSHLEQVGFLAENLKEFDISRTVANDDALFEIARTLPRLVHLNISYCPNITEKGVSYLLDNYRRLESLHMAGNEESVTNTSMASIRLQKHLQTLNINFCHEIGDETIDHLAESGCPLKNISIASCDKVTGKSLINLIQRNNYKLEYIDFSMLPQKEFNNEVCKSLGCCLALKKLNLSGCLSLTNDSIANLIQGDKDSSGLPMKKEEGFPQLVEFRFAGNLLESESGLVKLCANSPKINFLDINGFRPLGETGLSMICKSLQDLRNVYLNFTEQIPDTFLDELRGNFPNVKFIRTIIKMSDPKDNNLYVPLPPKKLPKKKKKKGKKGKK